MILCLETLERMQFLSFCLESDVILVGPAEIPVVQHIHMCTANHDLHTKWGKYSLQLHVSSDCIWVLINNVSVLLVPVNDCVGY